MAGEQSFLLIVGVLERKKNHNKIRAINAREANTPKPGF